ncbi:Pyruvate dehydrogenase (acetyl-transferring) kinase 2 [Escovopsis weberi]|uniref:Protein-serine/threonine kinase n=1 Tax=Escovopsis weberi TaxID=150374 RepID=A0A0M8N384_ESCWE|nr:Pyruvate dehydrogenase (acetyl-transferring) kinase 2 [Escovopsis weberi]
MSSLIPRSWRIPHSSLSSTISPRRARQLRLQLPISLPISLSHQAPIQTRHNSKAANEPWRPTHIIDEWVAKEARPISLRQLMVFGRSLTEARLISSANYVRTELPVRLAHRIRDMQKLPYVIVTNPHLRSMYDSYYNAFDVFRKVKEIKTLEDNDRFCEVIRRNLKSHLTVIPKLAMGILECGELLDPKILDNFMNTMLRSRISRRVIAEQHLALTETYKSETLPSGSGSGSGLSDSEFIGQIFIKCCAKDVIDRCAHAVTALALALNGPHVKVPEITIDGHLDASFPYILSHLEYIIGELLRNSVQAVIDRQRSRGNDDHSAAATPPPVEVTICANQEHVIIRISDRGGGIPREELPHLWSFSKGPQSQARLENLGQVPRMAATMQELLVEGGPADAADRDELLRSSIYQDYQGYQTFQGSLASLTSRPPSLRLGMGLPLSRVYAEYWAGSLNLHSLEGYGVDAFLQISRLGNKNEQLTTRASMDAV